MTVQNNSAVSSTKWTVLSSIVNAILTVGIGSVLARLLTPEVFGLIAIAYLVIAFASYFVRLGVGPALIQKEILSSEDVSFAITFSMGLGLLAAALLALLSPLIASLFNKQDSAPVIAVMGLSLWFSSFSATMIGLLRRNMEFKFLSITSIAQTIFSGIFSIIMAKIGFGVWSLAWPVIISQLLVLLVFFFKIRKSYELHFRLSFSGHGKLIQFGTRYALINILEYFGANLDTILVGRLYPTNVLGLYNRAYRLAYLPTENLITSITSVMFPVFSRLQKESEKFKETQSRFFLLIGLLSTCIAMGMIPAAKDIVLVLLGSQWLDSVPIMVIVLIGLPFDFMAVTLGLTFDAVGKLKEKLRIQIITLTALLIGFIFLFHYGLGGILLSLILSHLLRFLLYSAANHQLFSVPYRTPIRNLIIIVFAGAVTFFGSQTAVHQTRLWNTSPFASLSIEILVCLCVFLLFVIGNSPTLLGVKNLTQCFSVIRTFLLKKGEK